MHDILKLSPQVQDELVIDYWQRQQKAIKSGYFNWMAHPDLYKRHGIGVADKFLPYEEQIISAMAECHVGAEINTSSLGRATYQTSDLMRLLCLIARFDVAAIMNDDAHHVAQLGQNYDKAIALSKQADIKKIYYPVRRNKAFVLEKFCLENQR